MTIRSRVHLVAAFTVLAIAAAVAGIHAAAPAPLAASTARHTTLVKSIPAKNDTIAASPAALQLWFSEKVEVPLLSVKLAKAGGGAVELGAPAYQGKPSADTAIALAVKAPLGAGRYTVNWTVAGKDGHPTKGAYDFVLAASR